MIARNGQTRNSALPRRSFVWRSATLFALVLVCAGGRAFAQIPDTAATPEPTAKPEPAASATAAPATDPLSRARKQILDYFDKFSDMTCKETVTQLVLNRSGRTIYRENSTYDYQFQTTETNGNWKFVETREVRNQAFRDPARSLLVTTGFASLLLVAHPMYEASYTFEDDGTESLGGVSYDRIRFKPVAGTSSPASLRLRGKNYPLPLSGMLWVDRQSGGIVRLEATVDSGLSDIGLASMHSEVYFVQHQFHGSPIPEWVPESATIDVQTPRQHWRNLHHFTDYKRFEVNVHEEIGKNP